VDSSFSSVRIRFSLVFGFVCGIYSGATSSHTSFKHKLQSAALMVNGCFMGDGVFFL